MRLGRNQKRKKQKRNQVHTKIPATISTVLFQRSASGACGLKNFILALRCWQCGTAVRGNKKQYWTKIEAQIDETAFSGMPAFCCLRASLCERLFAGYRRSGPGACGGRATKEYRLLR